MFWMDIEISMKLAVGEKKLIKPSHHFNKFILS